MDFDRTIQGVKCNDEEDAKKCGKLSVISDLGEHDYGFVVNCLWEKGLETVRKTRAIVSRPMFVL